MNFVIIVIKNIFVASNLCIKELCTSCELKSSTSDTRCAEQQISFFRKGSLNSSKTMQETAPGSAPPATHLTLKAFVMVFS